MTGCLGAFAALLATGEVPPPPPPPARAEAAAPTAPCLTRGEHRATSAHFAVEWDGDVIDEATADTLLGWLEDGWTVEFDELGWRAPAYTDTYLLSVFVEEGAEKAATTDLASCDGLLVPIITVESAALTDPRWAQGMAVHELNHASQFAYGYAWDFWFWEATAEWMQSRVYPDNTYWAADVYGYTNHPELAMDTVDHTRNTAEFWHMYGESIWALYLSEHLADDDLVRQLWEASADVEGAGTFTMTDAFAALGLDLDAAYADFVARNAVMDYAWHDALPSVTERDLLVRAYPAEDEVSGDDRPGGYGQTYTRFDVRAGSGDVRLAFSGDADTPWSVQLLEVSASEVLRSAAADVVDGEGEVTLDGVGGHDLLLVCSPLDPDGGRHAYAWEAAIDEPASPDTGDLGTPDEDAPRDEARTAGCGCAGVPSTAHGAVLVGLAAIVAVRRARGRAHAWPAVAS